MKSTAILLQKLILNEVSVTYIKNEIDSKLIAEIRINLRDQGGTENLFNGQ